jgi:CelD/BcsL family acetyltransferase involved in cellulose biosynthesis
MSPTWGRGAWSPSCEAAYTRRPVARARLIERLEDLDRHQAAWDALALAARQPLAAPGWLLAWWRQAAPEGALLRVVVLEDEDGSLVGIAPFFVQPGNAWRQDYRLLGGPLTQRREPLVPPGRERELAAATAATIATANPRPSIVDLEAIAAASSWPELLAAAYPGALTPRVVRRLVLSAPTVTLDAPNFETWLGSRSSNFRQQIRRARRQLADAGGRVRLGDSASLYADVDSFLRLHHARWETRGGSGIPRRTAELLLDAAESLGAGDRLRLWIVELGEQAIGAGLFVAGGGEIAYVNGGFDEAHSRLKPVLLAIAAAIEDGFARGEDRLDLGGGPQPYKLRFADADDPITWASLRVRDLRYPLTRAQLLKQDVRWWARVALYRLPAEHRDRLRDLRRRLARG